jgi:predicted ATP-grasp superfamily ATP-dependent carboligase
LVLNTVVVELWSRSTRHFFGFEFVPWIDRIDLGQMLFRNSMQQVPKYIKVRREALVTLDTLQGDEL